MYLARRSNNRQVKTLRDSRNPSNARYKQDSQGHWATMDPCKNRRVPNLPSINKEYAGVNRLNRRRSKLHRCAPDTDPAIDFNVL